MTRAFLGGYFTDFDDVYHTDDACPAGRLIPAELRKEEPWYGRTWCASCRAREEAELARTSGSYMLRD
jgi:hypothetical protein